MSVLQTRGGVPAIIKASVDSTGRFYRFPFTTSFVIFRVDGEDLRLFVSQKDFDDDVNYFTIAHQCADVPYGEFRAPIEAQGLWLKSASATISAVDLMVFQRRA